MSCKLCKTKPVWKFTNQQQLCSKCFVKYFEKKVKKTIRKYKMPINEIKNNNIKTKIINNITKNFPERKGKLSLDSLDDISTNIFYIMMYGNIDDLKKFIPKNQPLYFLSGKEILLYAKIKRIKGKIGEKENKKIKEINNFIQELEKKNSDIRRNVVNVMLRV